MLTYQLMECHKMWYIPKGSRVRRVTSIEIHNSPNHLQPQVTKHQYLEIHLVVVISTELQAWHDKA